VFHGDEIGDGKVQLFVQRLRWGVFFVFPIDWSHFFFFFSVVVTSEHAVLDSDCRRATGSVRFERERVFVAASLRVLLLKKVNKKVPHHRYL
jgi:hypothetical protein